MFNKLVYDIVITYYMCIYVLCYCLGQLFVLMNNLDAYLFFYFLICVESMDFVTLPQGTTALFIAFVFVSLVLFVCMLFVMFMTYL